MKRILSFILALVLLVSIVPIGAEAVQGGKLIALTFDDGPDSTDTVRLLDGLKERNAKVTFFTLGQNASNNLDLIRREYEEGHEVACHSWDHPDMTGLSDSQIRHQVEDSMAVLDKICGQNADYLFRAPYGSTNSHVRSLIDYPLIHWSIDPEDWKHRDTGYVRSHIVSHAFDGAIILVHDIHSTTIPAALGAIDDLRAQGYEFVTVSELFRRRNVALQNHVWHYDCKPNGTDLGPIAKPDITYSTDSKTVTITMSSPSGAPIYYTLDGSYPNQQAKKYTGPITVNYPCDLKAVAAFRLNGSRSEIATLASGKEAGATPVISMDGRIMTLTTATKGADIYYTTDGSDPRNGTLYTGPVEVPQDILIRAVSGGGFYKMGPELSIYFAKSGNLYLDMTPKDWYFEAMDRLVSEGLMKGMAPYRVAPNEKLTRGMLVTLLYRYNARPLEEGWQTTNRFSDVPADEYYAEPVEWAFRNGIVNGYSDTVFRPEGNITRQELCKVVDFFLKYRDHAMPAGPSCEGMFADYDQIDDWALPSLEAMVAAKLLQGDGKNVHPLGSATRAEVSAILCRMMDYEDAYVVPEPEVPETTAPEETTEPEETEPEETTEPVETTVPEETTEPEETEPEETTEPVETTVPEETTEPVETTVPEETTEPVETTVPEETTEPVETTVPEETTEPVETTVPEETTEPVETTVPEETTAPTEPPVVTGMEAFRLPDPVPEITYEDVHTEDWFYNNVRVTNALNLMNGTGHNLFTPEGTTSLAQVITVAVRVYEHYHGIADESASWPGEWYQYGLDRAKAYGILPPAGLDLSNPERPALRSEVAAILYYALPESELQARNQVTELPDYRTDNGAVYLKEVLGLYNAGILGGSDEYGTFRPDDKMIRAELAAVLCRMVQPETRLSFTLKPAKFIREICYGKSGAGRDLMAYRYGNGNKTLVLCFAIHGWEDNFDRDGMMLYNTAQDLRGVLDREYESLIRDKDWSVYVLPALNPDGLLDGWSHNGPGRCTTHILDSNGNPVNGNGKGIDMNRCFPYCFQSSYSSRNYTGDRPLGAAEAKYLAEFVQKIKGSGPNYLVDTHGWYNQIIVNTGTGGKLYKAFDSQFEGRYTSLEGAPGYFAAWAAYQAGYTETCLFEFPNITSANHFKSANCAARYHEVVRSILKQG